MKIECWFKCDKGWFGVAKREHRDAIEVYSSLNMPDIVLCCPHTHYGVSLFDMMTWAVQNSIPYEISTVEPKV